MKRYPIKELVDLRPKMYSVLKKKTTKGINKSVTQKMLHAQYFQVLFDEQRSMAYMTCLRSYKHDRMTVNIKKVDNKRHILQDKIFTLAHGHSTIPKQLCAL